MVAASPRSPTATLARRLDLPLPIARDPYSYVKAGHIKPIVPMATNLGDSGVRRAEHQIIRPSTAPPSHRAPPRLYTTPIPGAEAAGRTDKEWGHGITFPRGEKKKLALSQHLGHCSLPLAAV